MLNSEYTKNLNKEQKEAVMCLDGPLLIVAGAGSGKTKVLTTRIANIIKEKKAFPNQILAVTFTNKAAEEMRERLKETLSGKQLGVHLSTFHALGVNMLRKSIHHIGYRPNFIIYDKSWSTEYSFFKGIIRIFF